MQPTRSGNAESRPPTSHDCQTYRHFEMRIAQTRSRVPLILAEPEFRRRTGGRKRIQSHPTYAGLDGIADRDRFSRPDAHRASAHLQRNREPRSSGYRTTTQLP